MKFVFLGLLGLLAYAYFGMSEVDEQAEALRTWNFAAASQENRKVMLDKLHTKVSTRVAEESQWTSEFKVLKSEAVADKLAIVFVFQMKNEAPKMKRLNRESRMKIDEGFSKAFCSFYATGGGKFDPVRFDVSIDHSSGHKIYNKSVVQSMCKKKPSLNQLGLRSNTI